MRDKEAKRPDENKIKEMEARELAEDEPNKADGGYIFISPCHNPNYMTPFRDKPIPTKKTDDGSVSGSQSW